MTRVKMDEIYEFKYESYIKEKLPKLTYDLIEEIIIKAELACEEYLIDFSNGWNEECEDTFPCTHCLSKNYYIESISIYQRRDDSITLSIMLHFLEKNVGDNEDDYLGMEVYFELDKNKKFHYTGDIDTSSI